jgi:hypothetical protein
VVGSATDGFNNNFEDTYRAIVESVTPDTIGASDGAIRSKIIVQLQDNYGNVDNTTGSGHSFELSESSTTTETWWDTSSGGSGVSTKIAFTIPNGSTEDSVWYSNNTPSGPNTLVLTEPAQNFANNDGVVSANGETIIVVVSNIVTVSPVVPAKQPNDANMDTTGTAGQFDLSVNVDDGEDSGVSDDFRIIWGVSNSASPGSYGVTDTSADLSPPANGGDITHTVFPADLNNLGAQYDYIYWWLENLSTDPDATTLDGGPISSNPNRLIINPNLVTAGGDNGTDVSPANFTSIIRKWCQ